MDVPEGCEYYDPNTHDDCGMPSEYSVYASYGSGPVVAYAACDSHPMDVLADLLDAGFTIHGRCHAA